MKNLKMENNKFFTQDLLTLSKDDLRYMNSMIIDAMKMKLQIEANMVKPHIKIGGYVSVNEPRLHGKKLIVRKINPKKVLVEDESCETRWRVPYSMIDTVYEVA